MFISHAVFFAPQTIFTFQGSLPEFRWHDQSEFREIINALSGFFSPGEIQREHCMKYAHYTIWIQKCEFDVFSKYFHKIKHKKIQVYILDKEALKCHFQLILPMQA